MPATAVQRQKLQVLRSDALISVSEEKRLVKGPVLRPGVYDQYNTMFPEGIIEDAAHDFVARLHRSYQDQGTGPKLMHTGKHNDGQFRPDFEIVESYITTQDETFRFLNRKGEEVEMFVPRGSWMAAMRINSDEVWKAVKAGNFGGFSIGGEGDTIPEEEYLAQAG